MWKKREELGRMKDRLMNRNARYDRATISGEEQLLACFEPPEEIFRCIARRHLAYGLYNTARKMKDTNLEACFC